MEIVMKCNGVFEGGGVRGIGHVGAICALEQNGYTFKNLAGSSAGAIVAALLAVGYTCGEIKYEMENLDYTKIPSATSLDKLGTLGKAVNLWFRYGIFKSDYFYGWISRLLQRKGTVTFGDLKYKDYKTGKYDYKLKITASNITTKTLMILPDDIISFGINPDQFKIADAVRMSMSIPFYFEPVILKNRNAVKNYIVDGGLLNNYPIWLLDDGSSVPTYPTFGFKFSNNQNQSTTVSKLHNLNLYEYSMDVVDTLLGAADAVYISESKGDLARSILIPTVINVDGKPKNIKATYFDITKNEQQALYNNGVAAATKFLRTWNFEEWKRTYRSVTSVVS